MLIYLSCSKVVEYRGLYAKRWKVEVYLFDFRLCLCSNQNEVVIKKISKVSSVGKYLYDVHVVKSKVHLLAELDLKMKETFSIDEEVESRVWLCYRANQFVLLSKPSQTLADAGVFNGQVSITACSREQGLYIQWPAARLNIVTLVLSLLPCSAYN